MNWLIPSIFGIDFFTWTSDTTLFSMSCQSAMIKSPIQLPPEFRSYPMNIPRSTFVPNWRWRLPAFVESELIFFSSFGVLLDLKMEIQIFLHTVTSCLPVCLVCFANNKKHSIASHQHLSDVFNSTDKFQWMICMSNTWFQIWRHELCKHFIVCCAVLFFAGSFESHKNERLVPRLCSDAANEIHTVSSRFQAALARSSNSFRELTNFTIRMWKCVKTLCRQLACMCMVSWTLLRWVEDRLTLLRSSPSHHQVLSLFGSTTCCATTKSGASPERPSSKYVSHWGTLCDRCPGAWTPGIHPMLGLGSLGSGHRIEELGCLGAFLFAIGRPTPSKGHRVHEVF